MNSFPIINSLPTSGFVPLGLQLRTAYAFFTAPMPSTIAEFLPPLRNIFQLHKFPLPGVLADFDTLPTLNHTHPSYEAGESWVRARNDNLEAISALLRPRFSDVLLAMKHHENPIAFAQDHQLFSHDMPKMIDMVQAGLLTYEAAQYYVDKIKPEIAASKENWLASEGGLAAYRAHIYSGNIMLGSGGIALTSLAGLIYFGHLGFLVSCAISTGVSLAAWMTHQHSLPDYLKLSAGANELPGVAQLSSFETQQTELRRLSSGRVEADRGQLSLTKSPQLKSGNEK